MRIEKADYGDLGEMMPLYEKAREFMAKSGNASQWVDGYPSEDVLKEDIDRGQLYVCRSESGEIEAAFCFIEGNDPTYDIICEGEWLDDQPYGVVHRIVSSGREKRISDYCLEWCFDKVGNMRIDTHEDNRVMRAVVERNGYEQVGIILCHNGTPRVAYHKNKK